MTYHLLVIYLKFLVIYLNFLVIYLQFLVIYFHLCTCNLLAITCNHLQSSRLRIFLNLVNEIFYIFWLKKLKKAMYFEKEGFKLCFRLDVWIQNLAFKISRDFILPIWPSSVSDTKHNVFTIFLNWRNKISIYCRTSKLHF